MIIIDNVKLKLGEVLKKELDSSSKIKICAAYFSIYAFSELKKELSQIKEFSFLFNSPTFFHNESENKKQKEFFIPPFVRERTIAGGEFEIKLRNSLSQRAIAKECREWIEKKCKFKTLRKNIRTNNGLFIEDVKNSIAYTNFDSFTADGLGFEQNNELINPIYPRMEGETAKQFIEQFNQVWAHKELTEDVTEKVISYISSVHKENSPEYLYFITLYNIFNEFLEDINEDNLANEKTGFKDTVIWNMMYNFQKDAVLGGINKLEKFNGCILADSVGLGKTFTALGIIKYYELRNKHVLVLCPKRLSENWNLYTSNYKINLLIKDRFNYDVLFHTDLSRDRGDSNGINLELINWGNYDLIVIDESHNFRNNTARADRDTRYQRLMNKVIKSGVKTKVLMLSATPVNTKFLDLKNQLALAYEGDSTNIGKEMNISKDIESVFRDAQAVFNKWSKLEANERTTQNLLNSLSFDFFELLDSVTIARSRKHILKYYDTKDIGKFPTKNKPINKDFELTSLKEFPSFKDIFTTLSSLNLEIYTPSKWILPEKKSFYEQKYDTQLKNRSSLKQSTRESGIMKLMRVNLLKRLESSIEAYKITLTKLNNNIKTTLGEIDKFNNNGSGTINGVDLSNFEDDDIDQEDVDNVFSIGTKIKIDLGDMDVISWERELKHDTEIISELLREMERITPEKDSKLNSLKDIIESKIKNPINPGNKKVIVFSAFADTVHYLYDHISKHFLKEFNLHSACISGTKTNKSTLNIGRTDMNNILTFFTPISKKKKEIGLDIEGDIDILIATDCISEGQNLQDCDYLINYDIHWNPVRIIQRFGRIDRIGSLNELIQLVNFWPPVDLDEYINLKSRVEGRMIAGNLASGGEENVISKEDSVELEYRHKQLAKLKQEVVDLEEMENGVSITDLGLNDFRIDLVNYFNEKGEIKNTPFGLHAIVNKTPDFNEGVIFVLKNLNQGININNTNRLHPFYLVYIGKAGEIISNHLDVKNTLDIFRALAKNKPEPDYQLCKKFNDKTEEGQKMNDYSDLLHKSINSIITVKEDADLNSIFRAGGTSISVNDIKGLNDFELICFLVIQ
ncbi:MAG: helicase-related protein [Candidatus Methanoperedens sp.]